jgi:hypothetical protein
MFGKLSFLFHNKDGCAVCHNQNADIFQPCIAAGFL